ncbi:unnamed protein product [Ambrosiozyma monospora]|uniref:Unnamed protein product n=1 Tax=Ambrosiozyma monospora TaxID=43982 RepID=A0A9W6Z8A0_AMBMO|nr:unnamed protein product [Ambrosiozyma monospora]
MAGLFEFARSQVVGPSGEVGNLKHRAICYANNHLPFGYTLADFSNTFDINETQTDSTATATATATMSMTTNMFSDDEDDDYNDYDSVCHTQNNLSGTTTPTTSMSTSSSRVASNYSSQIERDQAGVIMKGIVSSAVVQERLVQKANSITSGKPPPPLPQRRQYFSTPSFGYSPQQQQQQQQQQQNQLEIQHRLEEILDKVNVDELQTGLDSLQMLCCNGSSTFNSLSETDGVELQAQLTSIPRSSSDSGSGSSFIGTGTGTGTTKSTKQKLIANSIAMIVDSISNDREMLKLVIDQLGDGCFENGKRMMSPVKFQLLKMINSQACHDNAKMGNGNGMNPSLRRRSNTVSGSRRKSIERLNQEKFVGSEDGRSKRQKQWYGDVSKHSYTVNDGEFMEDDQEFEFNKELDRVKDSHKYKDRYRNSYQCDQTQDHQHWENH